LSERLKLVTGISRKYKCCEGYLRKRGPFLFGVKLLVVLGCRRGHRVVVSTLLG
jgi:hypothetical protein